MYHNPADYILELVTDQFESENIKLSDKNKIKINLINSWKKYKNQFEDQSITQNFKV